jgi:hypothetical protein
MPCTAHVPFPHSNGTLIASLLVLLPARDVDFSGAVVAAAATVHHRSQHVRLVTLISVAVDLARSSRKWTVHVVASCGPSWSRVRILRF